LCRSRDLVALHAIKTMLLGGREHLPLNIEYV
jgi:hypothetical protein